MSETSPRESCVYGHCKARNLCKGSHCVGYSLLVTEGMSDDYYLDDASRSLDGGSPDMTPPPPPPPTQWEIFRDDFRRWKDAFLMSPAPLILIYGIVLLLTR